MTQEYTPVSWQDETTSQQGTLINAERLNQMQTAHHFADGLEEVDAVPTADPGVAYHKIVYCTADSTLYRWDGTEWTKDIDDDTKALLLAHEADHDNPHQVTKSQVGLGNADNTADLDKPISTATQTALNAKADKATTYTKAQTDTLLAGKVDKQDSSAGMIAYTAEEGTEGSTEVSGTAKPATIPIRTADGRLRAYFDDADPYADDCVTYAWTSGQLADIRGTLDYKADKSDTYTKAEIDTAMATKADKATTLAGYGITDAYTKSQVDTYLAAKADQATTYTKTETDSLLASKANASEVVTLDTAQTIPGEKQLLKAYTFKKYIQTFGGSTAGYRKLWTFSGRGVFNMGAHSVVGQYRALSSARYLVEFYRSTFDSTDNKQTLIYSTANISYEEMVIGANINPAEGEGGFAIYGYMVPSSTMEFMVDTPYNEDGTFKTNFAESNDSTVYSLATIGAIVPIANPYNLVAALDGYLPMVRTSGAQIIGGEKTLVNNLILYNPDWNTAPRIYQRKNIDSTEAPTAYTLIGGGLVIQDKNSRTIWELNAYRDTNGRDVFSIQGQAYDGTTGYFHFELSPNSRKITTNFDKPSAW